MELKVKNRFLPKKKTIDASSASINSVGKSDPDGAKTTMLQLFQWRERELTHFHTKCTV